MAQVSKKSCEICEQAPGTYYCLDCEQYYCNNCKVHHKKQKPTEFREANSLKLEPKIGDLEGNIKQVSSGLQKFEGEIAHVIRTTEEEGKRMKAMIDLCIAEKIKSVQGISEEETMKIKQTLNKMKTELKSMQTMDTERKKLEKARPDGALIKKLQALQLDIDQLTPTKPPEIPSITCIPGKVKENDVKQLLGTFDFRQPGEKKSKLYRCKECGYEKKIPLEDLALAAALAAFLALKTCPKCNIFMNSIGEV